MKFLLGTTALVCLLGSFGLAGPAQAQGVCTVPSCLLPDSTAGTPGVAGTPGSFRTNWETTFSVGAQWNFTNWQPEVVAAVRRTATQPHQQVYGGQVDIAMPVSMANPFQWPTVRLLGLAGGRYAVGQLGLGVQTANWRPLVAGGVQVPYATAGANYVFGQGFSFYAGANAFGRFTAPTYRPGTAGTAAVPGTLSCSPGTTLTSVTDPSITTFFSSVSSLVTTQGKTCLNPLA